MDGGPVEICRFVYLREQSEHTAAGRIQEPGRDWWCGRQSLWDQGPKEGVWRSRPRVYVSVFARWPLLWIARGKDGQIKGRTENSEMQKKNSFDKSLPAFPSPILCLDIWHGTHFFLTMLLLSPAFLSLFPDNYSFISFSKIAHCLTFLLFS